MRPEQLLTVDPAAIAERAQVLETFASVEEVEAQLARSRDASNASQVPQFLRDAAESTDVRVPPEPIRSHRRLVGPLIVHSKRLFRAGFQPFINELFRAQVIFNERIVGALTLLHESLERQAAQERRWRADVEKRLEALERQGKE